MNQLIAMREAGVKMALIRIDRMEVLFENGVTVPIIAFLDENNEEVPAEEATHFDFGTEEFGFGHALWTYDEEVKEAM
jgi:hypothetical protein